MLVLKQLIFIMGFVNLLILLEELVKTFLAVLKKGLSEIRVLQCIGLWLQASQLKLKSNHLFHQVSVECTIVMLSLSLSEDSLDH
jgi:hypothetical protein